MTDKDVNITTKDECGTPLIDAPPMTVIRKNNKIKFYNELDSTGAEPDDGAEVSIKFYAATDTGNVDVSAEELCDGYTGGMLLTIDANDSYDCKSKLHGPFKYDVSATGYDVTLDPVIIVEAPPGEEDFGWQEVSPELPNAWMIGGAILLAIVSFFIGRRLGPSRT